MVIFKEKKFQTGGNHFKYIKNVQKHSSDIESKMKMIEIIDVRF